MNKEQIFESKILDWYKKNGRKHLPWRKKGVTPYEVWVSEIMLQQTQVSRVIEYYSRFLQVFPTVFDLAKATWEEFYPYYAGLGYYNRGRNMLRSAQMVVEKYNEKFPKNKDDLLALPGIGDYTASAILSFGYNQDEIAIDTNIKKVLGRVFVGTRLANLEKELFVKNFGAKKKDFNAAIMDFSSTVCLKIPRCGECPLRNMCEYYQTDGQTEEVKAKKKEIFPNNKAKVYLTLHKNHREYYSTSKKEPKPFILSAKYNTREKIKEYFQTKYSLTLSVRPPHKKLYIEGKPVIFVNAQILLGKHKFYTFDKKYGIKRQ